MAAGSVENAAPSPCRYSRARPASARSKRDETRQGGGDPSPARDCGISPTSAQHPRQVPAPGTTSRSEAGPGVCRSATPAEVAPAEVTPASFPPPELRQRPAAASTLSREGHRQHPGSGSQSWCGLLHDLTSQANGPETWKGNGPRRQYSPALRIRAPACDRMGQTQTCGHRRVFSGERRTRVASVPSVWPSHRP